MALLSNIRLFRLVRERTQEDDKTDGDMVANCTTSETCNQEHVESPLLHVLFGETVNSFKEYFSVIINYLISLINHIEIIFNIN